jgi:hypothetical protein
VEKGGLKLGGCRYMKEPGRNTTDPMSRIEFWADFFSIIDCKNYLVIEGPAGLPYK